MNLRLNQKGDTLIEVTMSIAILAVVLVTAFNVANLTLRTGMQARERSEAARIAQGQAERLRAWRDSLVQLPDGSKRFFNSSDIGVCTPSTGCVIRTLGANTFDARSCPGAAECREGIYTIRVNQVGAVSDVANFRVRVEWDSASSGVQNVTEFPYTLADTSDHRPVDCSENPEDCQ